MYITEISDDVLKVIISLIIFAKDCGKAYIYEGISDSVRIKYNNEAMDTLYKILTETFGNILDWDIKIKIMLGFYVREIKNRYYALIPLYLYNLIPNGTKLICANGDIVIKGIDEIVKDEIDGVIPYAIYKEVDPPTRVEKKPSYKLIPEYSKDHDMQHMDILYDIIKSYF